MPDASNHLLASGISSYGVLYKRGVVMSGVVSLTMGNSSFPFTDCFIAYVHLLGQLQLRHVLFFAQFVNQFANFCVVHIITSRIPL